MINNFLKSKRASSLVMTLIIVSVIAILGVALMSMAVVNYRTRRLEAQQKANFYLAESGTEEAYAKTLDIAKAAIALSNNCIEDFINNKPLEAYEQYWDEATYEQLKEGYYAFLESEKIKMIKGEESEYLNPDLSIKEAAVKAMLNNMFQVVYKKYINENLPAVYDISSFKTISNPNRFQITSQLKPFDQGQSAEVDVYNIDITSAYYNQDKDITSLDKYKSKEINIIFQLKVPSYGDSYKAINKEVSINESPLWSKALAADKSIKIRGSNADVTINGEIYAYGISPTDEDYSSKQDLNNYAGIVLESEGQAGNRSLLEINGNIATNSNLMATKDYSRIKVNGNVFCNTLAIPSGIAYSTIEISGNKNVYASDDIELNGSKSIIFVEGNYYGFGDGEAGHDKSSSIVINSPDIDLDVGDDISPTSLENPRGSMLKITGEVFLAGTAYINTESIVPDEQSYQTGDSVSIKKGGNIEKPEINNYMVYSEEYALRNEENKMDTENDKSFLGSKIEFLNYPPLYLAYNFLESTNNSERFFKAKTRSQYAYTFYKYRNEPSIVNPELKLNLGGTNSIQINESRVLYSLGNYISEGVMYKQKLISDPDYENYKTQMKRNYNFYVNKLASVSKHQPNSNYDDNKNGIDNYASFMDYNNLSAANQTNSELLFVQRGSKPLLIKGRNGDKPAEITGIDGTDYYLKDLNQSSELRGIVLTQGDVYITGEIDFYGTIITTGNIYIIDSGKKVFNNNGNVQQYLQSKLYNTKYNATEALYTLFINSRQYSDIARTAVVNVTAESVNLYEKYDGLLSIVEWKKTK